MGTPDLTPSSAGGLPAKAVHRAKASAPDTADRGAAEDAAAAGSVRTEAAHGQRTAGAATGREPEFHFREMAIVAPLLFVLTLGALELGHGVWTKHTLTHVAREAARYASVRSASSASPATAAAIEARVKEGAVGIDAASLEVETTWTPANVPGATVRVDVRYALQPITPLIPIDTIRLVSYSQRVVEN